MKKFFTNKFNIIIISVAVLSIVSLALYTVDGIFYLLFTLLAAADCVLLAVKLTLVKRKKDEITADDFYFDATELSYDEDVYFIGDDERKVPKKKGRFARFDSWSGIIALYVFAIMFLSLFVVALV